MELEVWKFIEGFPYHMISNHGRVRNIKLNIIMKATKKYEPVNKRYFRYRLSLKYKSNIKSFAAHMLVATYFVDNPNNYTKVIFIDDNPENIKSSNLKWISDKEYLSIWKSKLPESPFYYGNKEKPIIALNTITNHEIEFDSIMEAANHFKTRHSYINKVLKGVFKTHKKYNFRYKNLEERSSKVVNL